MALLRNGGRRQWRLLPSLALLAAGTSCALLSVFGGDARFGFGHRVHLAEGLECGDCHADWQSADAPGLPRRGGCMLCHESIDQQKTPERRIDVLFVGDEYRLGARSRLDDEVVFSHRQHAAKPIDCKNCHIGIESSDGPSAALAMRMADCESCHQRERVVPGCATCHRTERVDVLPRTHEQHWRRRHGATQRAHDGATVNQCAMCHEESTCRTCHAAEAPDNHDNYFRRRGHGLHARMDRQNCAACHRSDSCAACHQDTRPINHVGTFGGVRSNHCIGCHLPVRDNECATCHRGTPSHELAPVQPAGHTAGMNCRQCHGAGQALQHADNGTDCNQCHR